MDHILQLEVSKICSYHLCGIIYDFFKDFIMKTEAIRIATTFDVSYKMRIGSERINQFVKQAESDENNISISKFLKLLKNL